MSIFQALSRNDFGSPGTSTPSRPVILQRKCACGCGAECDGCRREKLALDSTTVSSAQASSGYDFSRINIEAPEIQRAPVHRFFEGRPRKTKKPQQKESSSRRTSAPPAKADQCYSKCGGMELGSFECELDPKTGLPTEKVVIVVRETDPCIAPCVSAHENVHKNDFAPICQAVHGCLEKAGGDFKKQTKCLDIYETSLKEKSTGDECAAYRTEEECLRKRKSSKECSTEHGRGRWTEQIARTDCYKKCFCKE